MATLYLEMILLLLNAGLQSSVPRILEISPEETETVSRIGSEEAGLLITRLTTALREAMAEGGPVGAVPVCSREALPLTRDAARDRVIVKRTTSKFRNPENAPDDLEIQALHHFEELLRQGERMPRSYVQKFREGEQTLYRYYQPLITAALCLTCHGEPGRIPDGVRTELQRLYPEDRATGYREGEFRGLIRVEIPAEILEGR